MDHKNKFLDNIFSNTPASVVRVCDLGSGDSRNWNEILSKYPNVEYWGFEIDKGALDIARRTLNFGSRVHLNLGFSESIDKKYNGFFDIVISMSVLEHVKYIDSFIRRSVEMAKPNGEIIHRYDLGHYYYPSSLKERLLVHLCRRFPTIMPANKFTTYYSPHKIIEILESNHCLISSVRQTQMPTLKSISKILSRIQDKNLENINIDLHHMFEHEACLYQLCNSYLSDTALEYFFPTIEIYARKQP